MEDSVAQHYTHGSLEEAILSALAASGKDSAHQTLEDLAPVDEFHVGGRQATMDLAAQLPFKPEDLVLDIGSGLGGASRYFAQIRRCRVIGIDLTEEYVRTPRRLRKVRGWRAWSLTGKAVPLRSPSSRAVSTALTCCMSV